MTLKTKHQIDLYDRMQKFIRNYKKDSESRKTKEYLNTRLESFNDYWEEFKDNHKNMPPDIPESDSYFKDDLYSEVEDFYINNKSEILTYYNSRFPEKSVVKSQFTKASAAITSESASSEAKLPLIRLPIFSGKYEEFASFKDLFTCMIHDNSSLNPCQKLYYLKTHLSHEAEQLVKNYPVTENNYDVVWAALLERYENKRVLINHELKTILFQPRIHIETVANLKSLIDNTQRCILSLKNLNLPVAHWDQILVFVIVQKLPINCAQKWEQAQSTKPESELPTFDELITFLTARFRALEAVPTSTRSNPKLDTQNPSTRRAHHTIKSETCSLCNQPHQMSQCREFKTFPDSEKVKIVNEKKLCFNCLSSRHQVRQCQSKFSCFKCKKRHHSQLHDAISKTATQPNYEDNLKNLSATPENEEPADVSAHFSQENPLSKQILLSTAMIKVIDRHGNETTARALVDQGSQSSFVLESLTKRLNFKTKSTRAQITGIGSSGEYCRKSVTLGIKSMSGNKIIDNAEALVLKNLTSYGQNLRLKVKDWKHINGLKLADPYFSKPGKIEVLLGADLFPYILTDGLVKGPPSTPMAQNTLLGWILVGPVTCQTENAADSTIQVTNLHSSSLDLSDQLKRFWELEEVQAPTRSLPEDEQC
ncbi:hypothetical protein JTE90_025730 [Oedothorax gibbosus]|uniref:CCHC-type domain-containing protein n=1 Tax=Oedothorax gibbosus TaxID=931172 RepID=A0AAV6UVV6_9ARAC|nr:hypothetical protein JTE90_025730 [Oedothorax gibbosus]